MAGDAIEPAGRSPDDLAQPDACERANAGDLRARLESLPAWHPSSPHNRSYDEPPRLRAKLADGEQPTDTVGAGATGWEFIGPVNGDRPAVAGIRMTNDRRTHILDGDQTGGGHRHGGGSPGKTEFPVDWDDDKIMMNVLSVAREPDQSPVRQNWNDRWRVHAGAMALRSSLSWPPMASSGQPGRAKAHPVS